MQILAIISGEYGSRHVDNIRRHGPETWSLRVWQAPTNFPLVIDYPEDFLPAELPPADLILSFAEHKGVAELLPDIARMTGAKAVIAAIDNEAWLPRGLARQLHEWLGRQGVSCATPKPLCSLTTSDYGVSRRERRAHHSPLIAEFASVFGQPEIHLTIDPQTRIITGARAARDAVCGCARFVAEGLLGVSVDDAEERAGLRHHHYPCLATMGKDPDFGDTLMHVSGNIMKDRIATQVKPFKQIRYIAPGTLSSDNPA